MPRARVIVLGNQKSGTTAIACLLAELTGMSSTIDLPRSLRAEGYALVKGGLEFGVFLQRHPSLFAKELVKIPSLAFVVGEIRNYCPEATVIRVVCDPRDKVRSLLSRRGLPGDKQRLGWHHHLRMALQGRSLIKPLPD